MQTSAEDLQALENTMPALGDIFNYKYGYKNRHAHTFKGSGQKIGFELVVLDPEADEAHTSTRIRSPEEGSREASLLTSLYARGT